MTALMKDAQGFIQEDEMQAAYAFHAMKTVCRKSVSKKLLDEVMWGTLTHICSGPAATSPVDIEVPVPPVSGTAVDRFRYFTDNVKKVKAFKGTAETTTLDETLSAALVNDALSFAKKEGRDAGFVFGTIKTLCANPVSRDQYKEIMWAALNELCRAPVSEVPAEKSSADEDHAEVGTRKRKATSADQGNAAKERRSLSVESAREDTDENPVITPTPISSPSQQWLQGRLDRLFSSAAFPPEQHTVGMEYIANRHAHLAVRQDFDRLKSSFIIFDSVGMTTGNMHFLFGATRRVLAGKSLPGDLEISPSTSRAFAEMKAHMLRQFDAVDFRAKIDLYCHTDTSSVRMDAKRSALAARLAKEATQGRFDSIRRTIDYFEMIGIEHGVIGRILQDSCPSLLVIHV